MKQRVIACFGSGKDSAGKVYRQMEIVGKLLAEHDCIVITGGFGGSGMEAPLKGAKSANGQTIGYTMLGKTANAFADTIIDCGQQYSNRSGTALTTEEQYGLRLANLMKADAFVVSDAGGIGTVVELCAIINFALKIWQQKKPIAILVSEYGNLKLLQQLTATFFDKSNSLMYFHDPAKAVGWVTA